jgi:hypothetical protein
MQTDPRVVDAQSKALYYEAIYRLTKAAMKNAQRNWDTISRRITQRGQAIERMKREQNVGSIPVQARAFRRPNQ